MKCRIEVKNDILGNSVFWEGSEKEVTEIRSIPAKMVAEAVFRTGEPKHFGMWYGFPVSSPSGSASIPNRDG